jgi:beta-glucosidase
VRRATFAGVTDHSDPLARRSLPEKVKLLSGKGFWHLHGIPELALEPIMVTDGPHGLRQQDVSEDHLGIGQSVPSTCFPTAATLGATWDEALLTEIGEALGEEARAQGVAVILGPGLNLKRHPAGGRNFEYLSEDPLLSGRLAAAMVRGVQSKGVGACLKHYAANNQESHRLVVDTVVDERTLRELYLTGFEIAVKESEPWTVMCAYNLLNGTYCSEHHALLTTILREEWGFEGLVMTDWGATNDRAAGIAAGLDLEMPGSKGAFDAELLSAVERGELEESAVDACVSRVVALSRRGQPDGAAHDPAYETHHDLARRAAAAGSVLLTNDGTLPLAPFGTVALVGAFAESPRYQGAGSSQVTPRRLDEALDVLRGRLDASATLRWAPGYDARTGATTAELVDQAVRASQGADVAVVFAGLPAPYESEGFDRTSLELPEGHTRLIEAVAATNPRTVVVLANGAPVHLPWRDRVAAVLETYLGGEAGGAAVVDVLLGDAEPGGRLAESFCEHVAQLPADRNFPGLPRQVQYREGLYVGYRFHDAAGVPAAFPFGHGLSYTSFEWGEASVAVDGTDVEVRLTVTNTGAREGSDVVQVYVRDVASSVYRPDKELKGFAKVHLGAGESEEVVVSLDRRAFAVWDVAAHDWLVEAGEFDVLVGASSVDLRSSTRITIDSPDRLSEAPGPSGFVADDEEFAAMYGRAIPAIAPSRPFDRNSTLGEIEETFLGRQVGRLIRTVGRKRATEEFPDADDATIKMIESAMREGPARALVSMSGGMVPMATLDGFLDVLNRNWSSAIRRVRRSSR